HAPFSSFDELTGLFLSAVASPQSRPPLHPLRSPYKPHDPAQVFFESDTTFLLLPSDVLRAAAHKEDANESHVRALLRIGYPQSQHHGVRADQRKGEDSGRDAAFWDNDGGLEGIGRMAPAERNPTRGDGIDRSVLEASVEYFGACRVRVVIGERARSEGCTWAKDRPKRQPVDCRFA